MDIAVKLAVIVIACTPAIAFMDWMIFDKMQQKKSWTAWLPATFLEMTMLGIGMLIGRLL